MSRALSYLLTPPLSSLHPLLPIPYPDPRTPVPHYDHGRPSRSIHGIASWFSEGRLSSATPDGAPLAHVLSLFRCVYSFTGSPSATPLSLSRPSVRPPSLPVSLSFSPVLSPRLFAPLHTLSRSTAAEPDTRTRQLRNNNNAVRSVCSVRVHHTTRDTVDRVYTDHSCRGKSLVDNAYRTSPRTS